MNESVARDVLLVRAVETADGERALLTEDDRRYASRVAAELARWHAAERGSEASAELFVGKRAELLTAKLNERHAALARLARAAEWRPWIGVFAPLVALLAGVFLEHVTDRHHVNVLAFPLLGLVVWNLAVYAFLAVRALARAAGARVSDGALRAWIAGLAGRGVEAAPGPAGAAIAAFGADWLARGASLAALRAARVLHLSSALFAIGAIAGLYVRGLVLEYRAGWESTFLDPQTAHAILAFFLAPVAHLVGLPFPDADALAAIRWSVNPQGENAAIWIHLYAATVALVVIVPRLVLFLVASVLERRRAQHFPVDLAEPYFRRLLTALGNGTARLRVVPYSYTPDEATTTGLTLIARRVLGDEAQLSLRPSVPFGAEENAAAGVGPLDPETPMTVALFSLAATPESENHGVFLTRLRDAVRSPIVAIVDESAYRRRLGGQPGAAERLVERASVWRAFCEAYSVKAVCVDLTAPDLARAEREIEPALATNAEPSR